MKVRVVHKREGVQNVSAVACELGFAISTVNIIMKTAIRIREHVTGTAVMKPTAIMKKHEGAVTMLLEADIQKCVSLSSVSFF
jgi:hypothetical protein